MPVMTKQLPAAARLNEVLDYEPGTGLLRWKMRSAQRIRVGDIAGSVQPNGYIVVKVDSVSYFAHRLAWLIAHGTPPAGTLDHINGNRSDNRLCNLRECSSQENAQNRAMRRDNTVGFKNVSRYKAAGGYKFRAVVSFRGVSRSVGGYDDPRDAAQAAIALAREIHGDFSAGSRPTPVRLAEAAALAQEQSIGAFEARSALFALRRCHKFAAMYRGETWANTILEECRAAGVTDSVTAY